MPNLDQFFNNVNSDTDVDASREELLAQTAAYQQQQAQEQQAQAELESEQEEEEEEGGGFDVNELIGNGVAAVVDQFDNSRDYEEIRQGMRDNEAEYKKERAANPLTNALDEAQGIVRGAALGTVENIGETIELAGDGLKSFAGIASQTDNVFGNEYEWADWKLGKDTYGAQTGAGKVAQGFVEFGLAFVGTGGLSSVSKGAGIFRTVAHGAKSGMLADIITTAGGSGEGGNLSQMIKENAPEWYPDWLTALATDDDDNAATYMLKSLMEGTLLGAAADGAMAYLSGVRSVRSAPKGANLEEAAEKGVREQIERTNAARAAEVKASALGRAAQVHEPLQALAEQAKNGVPVYWDDVANVFPEYFAPGTREVGEFVPDVYSNNIDVINPFTGDVPTQGFVVDIDGATLATRNDDTIANFLARHEDILSREDTFIRTGPDGLDIVRVIDDANEAQLLGGAFDNSELINLADASTVAIKGASDSIIGTKGFHLDPPDANPGVIKSTEEPAQGLARQIKAQETGMVSGPVSRLVTTRQTKKIAKAAGPEAASVIEGLVKNNTINLNEMASITKTSPEAIRDNAVRTMAEALDTNTNTIDFSKISTQQVGDDVLLSPEGIVATRGLMQEMSSRIFETALKIKRMDAAEATNFAPYFDSLVEQLKTLTKTHKISANAYSRFLQTYQIDVPMIGAKIEMPGAANSVSVASTDQQIADAFKSLDELSAKVKMADPKAKSEAVRLATSLDLANGDIMKTVSFAKNAKNLRGSQLLSIMYNSMLSSPTTHLINNISNAINTVYRPLSAMVGGDAQQKKQAIKAFYAFQQNLSESAVIAKRTWKENGANVKGDKGIIARGEIHEAVEQLSIAAEASQDLGDKAAAGWFDTLLNAFDNPIFNAPSRLLTTSDEFFKAMMARMEFQSRTMGEAIDLAESSGKPLEDVFKELLDKNRQYNFGKESGDILNDDLLKVAKDVTFQTELQGQAAAFSNFINNVPVMRAFFPFVKTGHNILVYTGQHVPLLSKRLLESQAIMNGTDEYAKAVLKGRQAVGRYLVITAATAAYTGVLTGNGPVEPAERKIWLLKNQPRSIKIGDTFIDYSRIEPAGQIFSAVADLMDMAKYAFKHGLGMEQIEYLSGYLTYAIATNLTNKSYLAGVEPLSSILQPGQQGAAELSRFAPRQINNFLPLSGARRAFAGLMTPYMQEYQNEYERILASFGAGGLAFGSPAHDWLDGEQISAPAGGLNALNPLKVVKRKQSVVRDALEDIRYDSTIISKTINDVELTGEHKSELQRLMGESGLEKRLEKIVTSKEWIAARDKYYEDLRGGSKLDKRNAGFYEMVHDEIIRTRDFALKQLKDPANYPELAKQIGSNKMLQMEQKSDETLTTDDYSHLSQFYRQ